MTPSPQPVSEQGTSEGAVMFKQVCPEVVALILELKAPTESQILDGLGVSHLLVEEAREILRQRTQSSRQSPEHPSGSTTSSLRSSDSATDAITTPSEAASPTLPPVPRAFEKDRTTPAHAGHTKVASPIGQIIASKDCPLHSSVALWNHLKGQRLSEVSGWNGISLLTTALASGPKVSNALMPAKCFKDLWGYDFQRHRLPLILPSKGTRGLRLDKEELGSNFAAELEVLTWMYGGKPPMTKAHLFTVKAKCPPLSDIVKELAKVRALRDLARLNRSKALSNGAHGQSSKSKVSPQKLKVTAVCPASRRETDHAHRHDDDGWRSAQDYAPPPKPSEVNSKKRPTADQVERQDSASAKKVKLEPGAAFKACVAAISPRDPRRSSLSYEPPRRATPVNPYADHPMIRAPDSPTGPRTDLSRDDEPRGHAVLGNTLGLMWDRHAPREDRRDTGSSSAPRREDSGSGRHYEGAAMHGGIPPCYRL